MRWSRLLLCALGASAAVGCGGSLRVPPYGPHTQSDRWVAVPKPAPGAAQVEWISAPPHPGAVWVDGEWVWRSGRWAWRNGGWQLAVAHAYFAPFTMIRMPVQASSTEQRAATTATAGKPAPRIQYLVIPGHWHFSE